MSSPAASRTKAADKVALHPRQILWAEVVWSGMAAAVFALFPYPIVALVSLVTPDMGELIGIAIARTFASVWITVAVVYLVRSWRRH